MSDTSGTEYGENTDLGTRAPTPTTVSAKRARSPSPTTASP